MKEKGTLSLEQLDGIYKEFEKHKDDIYIKWWQKPLLWFLPTYVYIGEGYAFFYKTFKGTLYFMGSEELPTTKLDKESSNAK